MSRLSLQQQQNRFTQALRQPESLYQRDNFSQLSSAFDPVQIQERVNVYRNLVRHNLNSFIDHIFATSQAALVDSVRLTLFESFAENYSCLDPLFVGIPEQFYDHVVQQRALWQAEAPWLQALMHYELLLFQIRQFHADLIYPPPPFPVTDSTLSFSSELPPSAHPAPAPSLREGMAATSDPIYQLALPLWLMIYPYPVQSWLTQPELIEQSRAGKYPLLLWRNVTGDIQAIVPDLLLATVSEHMAEQKPFRFDTLLSAVQFVIRQRSDINQPAQEIINDAFTRLAAMDAFFKA